MNDSSPCPADEDLLRADGLRVGGPADLETALAIYATYAAEIDPSTPEGGLRVEWLLRLRRGLEPELEDLLRRASQCAADPEVREAAEVALFQFPFQRGDLVSAEAHLRTALRRHRGTGGIREIGVVNNLALVYQQGWREFEVLVLARRAHRLADAGHHVPSAAIAHSRIAWVLERLGEWKELAAQADAVEALLPALDLWHHPPALRAIHQARRAVCLATGDHDGARRHHQTVVAASTRYWRSDDDAFEGALLESRIALAEGRPADAAAAIDPHARPGPVDSANRVSATALLVSALAENGELLRAAEMAEPLTAVLRAGPTPGVAASVLLDAATRVGDALGEHGGATCYEAASALLMRRIAEIHECVAHIEELSGGAAEDRALLARYRARFVSGQRRALEAIAALWEDPAAGNPPELEGLAEDGQLRVCAWCLTMHTPDGLVLPVGHLVPGALRLSVTHGICDACFAALPR